MVGIIQIWSDLQDLAKDYQTGYFEGRYKEEHQRLVDLATKISLWNGLMDESFTPMSPKDIDSDLLPDGTGLN